MSTDIISSVEGFDEFTLSPAHPLYLHPSDSSDSRLIFHPFDDDESDFSYDENAVNGPGNWSNIHPDWIKCNTGKMQSPIDFPNKKVEVVSNLGILQKFYKPSNATLLNRGHDIMLRWDNGGFLKINGTQYQLKQVHWHTPSEHTIDGKRFDMEGHLVHETDDGKNIAVIGILYEIGLLPDLFLKIIEKDLKALADKKDAEKAIGIIDPNLIKLDGKKYYRNMGSLTVPPCSENVVWTIDGKLFNELTNGVLPGDQLDKMKCCQTIPGDPNTFLGGSNHPTFENHAAKAPES
ncbi:Alpha carbonic anhydrase 7 [Capsicum baccatum]|uniref:Carbonic anhydrase n=1 Tax=Capsicum baccatum TaxID=33114 RepID=A0A2G2WNM6_CAPBA|nr:Alpha carbonic anhydrase 7 [Capsicum baccatum]